MAHDLLTEALKESDRNCRLSKCSHMILFLELSTWLSRLSKFYEALTIHQLIQSRTPALASCTDSVLSGGFRAAALNALQDYTLRSASGRESPPQSCPAAIVVFFLAVDYGPQPLTCCLFKGLRALLPWQAGEDSLISALHLCTGSAKEWTASPAWGCSGCLQE